MSDMIMSFLPPLIDRMMLSNGVSLNDAGTPAGSMGLRAGSACRAARSASLHVPAALLPLLLGTGLALVEELSPPQPAAASPRAITAISAATPGNSPHLLEDLIRTPFVGGSPPGSPQCSYP